MRWGARGGGRDGIVGGLNPKGDDIPTPSLSRGHSPTQWWLWNVCCVWGSSPGLLSELLWGVGSEASGRGHRRNGRKEKGTPPAVGETPNLTRETESTDVAPKCLHHHLNFHHHPVASRPAETVQARHCTGISHILANPPGNPARCGSLSASLV